MPDELPGLTRVLGDHVASRAPAVTPPFQIVRTLRRRRRQRRIVAGGVVGAVAVVAVAAGVTALVQRPDARVSPAGTPAEIVVDGVPLRLAGPAQIERVRISETDRAVLVVEAGRAGSRPTACQPFVTRARVVAAEPSGVLVAAHLYEADLEPAPGTLCPAYLPGPATISLELGAPLDDRPVVDEATGEAVTPVDPARLLRPGELPAGYAGPPAWTYSPVGIPLLVTQTYPGPGGARLILDQAPGRPVPAAGRPGQERRDVTVRGHAGELTGGEAADRLCLEWVEGGSGVRVCSQSPGRVLPAAELVQVAESLVT